MILSCFITNSPKTIAEHSIRQFCDRRRSFDKKTCFRRDFANVCVKKCGFFTDNPLLKWDMYKNLEAAQVNYLANGIIFLLNDVFYRVNS